MNRRNLAVGMGSLVALVALNGLAYKYFWYWHYRPADIPMHLLGGFAIGAILLGVVGNKAKWWSLGLLVALVGIGWELFEFKFSHFLPEAIVLKTLPAWQRALTNSISDILFACLGALLAYAALTYGRNKKTEA